MENLPFVFFSKLPYSFAHGRITTGFTELKRWLTADFTQLQHSYILGGLACSFIQLRYIYTHRELAADFKQLCSISTEGLS
jgi:hypothetical protein